MIGTFGNCDIYSLHATGLVPRFEGAMISTNDGKLAERRRPMRHFGLAGADQTFTAGTNAENTEANAAIGLTSLDAMLSMLETDRHSHDREGLRGVLGADLVEYNGGNLYGHQYVVLAIDPVEYDATFDALAEHLGTHRVTARRDFTPPLHRVPPYRDRPHDETPSLPNAQHASDRRLVLPTGSQMDAADIASVCRLFRTYPAPGVSEPIS